MRKDLLLPLLALCASPLQSQFLYNSTFYQLEQVSCPYDPITIITRPVGWEVYQTTDGLWNGSPDSTRCIDVIPGNFSAAIELNQINPAEPLFVRARLQEYPPDDPFTPNTMFNVHFNGTLTPSAPALHTGVDCAQDVCSGLFLGIAIPDSFGTPGAATRFQTGLMDQSSGNPLVSYLFTDACFPTEKFQDQLLREFILKFSFDTSANLNGSRLELNNAWLENIWEPSTIGTITEVAAPQNLVNVAQVANQPSFLDSYLALYTATTYPSSQHLSYIEAHPEPNTSMPQTIVLTVQPWQTLETQPYAQFRGALVAGSDSVRHQFVLLNEGGEICANFADLIFDGGDEFRYKSGSIDINNAFSCMQFHNGSALRVLEGSTLHYGNNGAGMLALCANGSIVVEPNATLIVDCILNIAECNDQLPPQQIYLDLPPGARLAFTNKAWLTNRFSQGQKMMLNVRMLGGTLDDSALPPDSRALIRRIYPAPSPNPADNIQLKPNPFSGPLALRYLAGQSETLRLYWFEAGGRLVGEEKYEAVTGINEWTVVQPSQPGVYFLTLETPTGRVVKKLIGIRE